MNHHKWAPCPFQGKRDSWRTIWNIPGAGPELYIVRKQDQRGCEEPLPPAVACGLIDRWVVNRDARRELMELYGVLRAPRLSHPISEPAVHQQVKTRLRQAFERGELLLLRAPVFSGAGLGDVQAESSSAPPPQAARSTAKTWIEVCLVDMEGNPVGNKHYLIRTPSGTVEEGNLDGNGRVRLNNLDPGTCTISFPDLDQEAWERAPG
jgi:hypothetical protein